ncbi:hypothetical protein N7478_004273 [Penicillium angulare]|uniref:uncharacterized protein n=1 Tax=Penicillium angulare TaxID=116970 RepID=UPI0025423EFF|nr:uncharacterized protein N7478_004273 [Penicillium angulare]KAJ5278901.1 hypothetical protein N7478_004273 [Penicillium angulare]
MATMLPSTMRRSATSISYSALKASTRQPLLQRGCLSTTTRGISSLPPRNSLLTSHSSSYKTNTQLQNKFQCQSRRQIRWSSDESAPQPWRKWGFEEINTVLPSSSSSDPSHNPVILIDVREPAELNGTGIIPSAINIPLASQPDALYLEADEFETRFGFPKPVIEKDQQIVFYCKAGVRAEAAAQLAVAAGYDADAIGIYYGSWLDWAKNGGRVEKWEGDDF